MSETWDRWNDIAMLDPLEVPEKQRALYAIGWLRTEINSDGFDGLFFNLAGGIVPDAVSACRQAGVHELANLVELAMGVLGDRYPIDINQRQNIMTALSQADRERLNVLDNAYYGLEAEVDLDQLMIALDPDP